MNLYTILGAALVDPEFLKLLLENPFEAARKLGIFLTVGELAALKALLATEGIEDHLEDASRKICPKPPCTWSIAPPCDDSVSTLAAD
jgi:hypothetical protein